MKPSRILKPADSGRTSKNISLRVPAAIADRLDTVRAKARTAGMAIDISAILTTELERVLRVAEQELAALAAPKALAEAKNAL